MNSHTTSWEKTTLPVNSATQIRLITWTRKETAPAFILPKSRQWHLTLCTHRGRKNQKWIAARGSLTLTWARYLCRVITFGEGSRNHLSNPILTTRLLGLYWSVSKTKTKQAHPWRSEVIQSLPTLRAKSQAAMMAWEFNLTRCSYKVVAAAPWTRSLSAWKMSQVSSNCVKDSQSNSNSSTNHFISKAMLIENKAS